MADLQILHWGTASDAQRRRILTRGSQHDGVDSGLRSSIASIVDDVQERGDAALTDALDRFDRMTVPVERLRVSENEFDEARAAVGAALVGAIRTSIAQVRAFNEMIVQRSS